MSAHAFEIRCPACGSVVPAEASGCLNCTKTTPSRSSNALKAVEPELRPAPAPDLRGMSMKDYHRVVRENYLITEGPYAVKSGSRMRAYLPFVLLLIGIVVGAAVAFGHF
jgi:hypothetical protein